VSFYGPKGTLKGEEHKSFPASQKPSMEQSNLLMTNPA